MKKAVEMLKKYPLLVLFTVFMLGVFGLDMCFTSNPYSELENRQLKQKPVFTLESLFKNQYTKEYEEYINDQFVGRDGWITLKSVFESALAKTENNGVAYGADGYLLNKMYDPIYAESRPNGTGFGGDGQVDSSIPVVDSAQLERNASFLNRFLASYDGHVTVAIAPNSYQVLREKLPLGLPDVDQEKAIGDFYRQLTGENLTTLDLLAPLTQAAGEMEVCYRTDHHWTTEGAWVGYAAYAQSRGLQYASLEELAPYRREEADFLGTYYNKTKNYNVQPDTLVWYDILVEDVTIDGKHEVLQADGSTAEVTGIYQTEKFATRDKYAAFLYGNNGLTVIKTNNNKNHVDGQTSRVLLIKDSYGNCFAPFLTYSYDEVWVADLRNMTFQVSQVVSENQFDDVLVLYNFDTFQSDRNVSRIIY